MGKSRKIPGDRLLFALLSAYRTLVLLLDKRGVLDLDVLVLHLQQTAATHREAASPVSFFSPDLG